MPPRRREDLELLARFNAGEEEALAIVFERHRPVLRRHAARLLNGSGIDPEDVLQDAFLRVHGALRGGVAPIAPRAWLLRLVQNACIDELRLGRRHAGEAVELDALPSGGAHPPVELARRDEARDLLGDMSRLPDRQRDVLVLSALDGLSHEEVATRLDTTVFTTRSLLARARENLRRTAAARDTACSAVRADLEDAASAQVRASEIARRHLWSCADCRAHARELRPGRRRRRLAAWSPVGLLVQLVSSGGAQKVAVGVCCALMLDGAAVVPELVHKGGAPAPSRAQLATVELVPPVAPPKGKGEHRDSVRTAAPVAPPTPAATAPPAAEEKAASAKRRPASFLAASTRLDPRQRAFSRALSAFYQRRPSPAERRQMNAVVHKFTSARPGSTALARALAKAIALAYPGGTAGSRGADAPRKGVLRTPAPTQTPASAGAGAASPTPTPTPTPTPVATPTSTPTPTQTPTAVPATTG